MTAEDANAANKGWVFVADSSDGWDFYSSESGKGPVLTVTFSTGPEAPPVIPPVTINDDLQPPTPFSWEAQGHDWMLFA
jgi:hypothetical protein